MGRTLGAPLVILRYSEGSRVVSAMNERSLAALGMTGRLLLKGGGELLATEELAAEPGRRFFHGYALTPRILGFSLVDGGPGIGIEVFEILTAAGVALRVAHRAFVGRRRTRIGIGLTHIRLRN